eukprot:scaffold6562_cov120-Isochrysis_galbana.AAC.3
MQEPRRASIRLTPSFYESQEVRGYLDKHCSVEYCSDLNKFNEFPVDCLQSVVKKEAYMRGTTTQQQHVFNVASVTLAVGRQLLTERDD